MSPGGTRTITLGGRDYSFTEACWKYKDTWLTQPADNGSCESLMKKIRPVLCHPASAPSPARKARACMNMQRIPCETRDEWQANDLRR
uniref:Uncharacterized protein n=1 Tax=Klebsiella pneumoniae TaxID=573 RepID=A0A7T8TJ13_KLEPN|nr:hypothetical protein JJQ54_00085 [Klebsiella pneumoniae]